MIICKVWDAEYPWDVRVEKIALALTERGHDVHLVARNRDGRMLEESLPEATVHRLPPLPWLPRFLNAASMFPAFFNPRWAALISRTVQRTGAAVILCRDLPLAPTAVWVARRRGIPVVLDMAENYPAMLRAVWAAGRQGPFDWLVRNPTLATLVERWVLKRVDHVLVVVAESRQRLVALGVQPERITIVSNTPPRSRLERYRGRGTPAPNRPLQLVYLGLLEAPRGIGLVLDAIAEGKRHGVDVQLTVYGTGRDHSTFVDQAARLGLGQDIVTFRGHVPYASVIDELQRADVGLVPHVVDESWSTTIPNKLFDYMAAGLPVLSSDAAPAARIVRSAACGEVFRGSDRADLVRAIGRLQDPERRARYAAAARRAIAQAYHWEQDAGRLVAAIERVCTRTSPQHLLDGPTRRGRAPARIPASRGEA